MEVCILGGVVFAPIYLKNYIYIMAMIPRMHMVQYLTKLCVCTTLTYESTPLNGVNAITFQLSILMSTEIAT